MTKPGSEKIGIPDLAHPVLNEMQLGALAYAQANPVTFSEAVVLQTARERTGLADFGDEGFRDRLRAWMQALNEDTELSAVGRMSCFNEAVRFASNRLQAEDTIKRHPEILEIDVDQPLLIAGLPRSGTTY